MRRIAKGLLILMLAAGNAVFAADYRVLVVPDNISSRPSVDAMIYEESSEFFANQIINKFNISETIESPTVSEVRDKLSKNPRLNIATREAMLRFKKEYNINYLNVKKLAAMFNTNKVLLITTATDSQNYFMRRTFWDLLNVPGASVIDPAIKLSTYAVLIDTDRDINLWEDTFYKTISTCESRMVATQLGPQTQQLEKIRDYSRMLGPQIASNVQSRIVPASTLTRVNTINYGPKDFDNVFTKKFRWYKHGAKEIVNETDQMYKDHVEKQHARGVETIPDKFRRWKMEAKQRHAEYQADRAQAKAEKARLKEEKARLEQGQRILKQEQEKQLDKNIQDINNKKPAVENIIPAIQQQKEEIKKEVVPVVQPAKEEVKAPKNIDTKKNVVENIETKTQQPKEENVIEIRDIKTPEIPAVKKQEKPKQEEPKILNITKEEHLAPPQNDTVLEPTLKYYQPKQRIRPQSKNTTINDI